MGNTYCAIHIHYVFSTRGRIPMITGELRDRLSGYVGGILKKYHVTALCIGGTSDHLHILASLPTEISVAKVAQVAKGGSPKWIHDTFPDKCTFAWQRGYGAFSVSISQIQDTVEYIRNQEEHHRTRSFQDEYLMFLKKHGVQYDERYLWV